MCIRDSGYRKDSSGDRRDDTAWLDEIQFMDIVNVTGVEFSQETLTMPLARKFFRIKFNQSNTPFDVLD